jgi:hypothetical protein
MTIGCTDWKAVRQARGLQVTATCTCPTPGWGVELRRHDPQELGDELLLDLILSRPTGPVLQVITAEPVVYEEVDAGGCEHVSILPDGPRGLEVEAA